MTGPGTSWMSMDAQSTRQAKKRSHSAVYDFRMLDLRGDPGSFEVVIACSPVNRSGTSGTNRLGRTAYMLIDMRKFVIGFAFVLFTGLLTGQNAPVKSRGVPNAPILLEVYSDYQCHFCKILYEQTLVPLEADYVDKGKVYLVHHEYPLTDMHPYAMEAACYACAAHRVGKYEQACDVLFRHQDSWSTSGKIDETVCSVLTPAEAKKVRELAKDPAIAAEVRQEIQAAQAAKVEGTPTVILTYRLKQYRIPGSTGYPILKKFIDQLLSN